MTIFSIEKCSVRLGAFGAKLRRVESQWPVAHLLTKAETDTFMCIVSGQSARNIHKNKSCKTPQTKNTSDRVIFRWKTHKILQFSGGARPSSGLSENQSGFIIFTIQMVILLLKYFIKRHSCSSFSQDNDFPCP